MGCRAGVCILAAPAELGRYNTPCVWNCYHLNLSHLGLSKLNMQQIRIFNAMTTELKAHLVPIYANTPGHDFGWEFLTPVQVI